MPSFFLKKCWNIVGKDIISTMQSFFYLGFILCSINETLLSLVSKVYNPTNVSQFRPTSLCNVLYKAISKILVNRVKPNLSSCISDNNFVFIPESQILDNVKITHKVLIFSKTKGMIKKVT